MTLFIIADKLCLAGVAASWLQRLLDKAYKGAKFGFPPNPSSSLHSTSHDQSHWQLAMQ